MGRSASGPGGGSSRKPRHRSSSRRKRTDRRARSVSRWAVPVLGFEQHLQRVELLAHLGGQLAQLLVELEQLNVEVARRARGLLDPSEAGLEPGQRRGSEDPWKRLQPGSGAAHGHPQVVEELGVELVEGPVDVGLDGDEQPAQDDDGRGDGRDVGRELDAELGRDQPGRTLEPAEHRGQQILGDRRQPQALAEQAGDLVRLPLVAAEGRDLDGPPERPAPAHPVRPHEHVVVHDDPGHEFRLGVADADDLPAGGDRGERQQGPHLDHGGQGVGQGAGRQVPYEPGCGGGAIGAHAELEPGDTSGRGSIAQGHAEGLVAARLDLEDLGPPQHPTVEGVDERAPESRRPAGLGRPPSGLDRGDDVGPVDGVDEVHPDGRHGPPNHRRGGRSEADIGAALRRAVRVLWTACVQTKPTWGSRKKVFGKPCVLPKRG